MRRFWLISCCCLLALLLSRVGYAAGGVLPVYKGRVLYRGSRTPAPGLLVEIVTAKDDGQPTDEVLGSTRADAAGRFVVALDKPTDDRITLVVSAISASAESGGDRRQEGYQIRTVRRRLTFVPNPSTTKSNTVLIEPKARDSFQRGDQ